MAHTMREVARRAAVSLATVSRVLNNTQYISEEPDGGCSMPLVNSATSRTCMPGVWRPDAAPENLDFRLETAAVRWQLDLNVAEGIIRLF